MASGRESDCLNSCRVLEKHAVLEKLREHGFRITKQRELILDVILEGTCCSSKEIYAAARQRDPSVGFATVYRMVNLLEDIGIISRKNYYRIGEKPLLKTDEQNFICTITLSDDSTMKLTSREWSNIMKAGLRRYGLISSQTVTGIFISNTTSFHKQGSSE